MDIYDGFSLERRELQHVGLCEGACICVYKCVCVCVHICVYVRLFATVTTEQDSVSHLAAARPFIVLYTPVYVSPGRARVTLVGCRPFRQVEPPIGGRGPRRRRS